MKVSYMEMKVLLEWGGAQALPRAENLLREGPGPPAPFCPLCVGLSALKRGHAESPFTSNMENSMFDVKYITLHHSGVNTLA